MKLTPLKQWVCDRCREVIDSAEDGFMEWITDAEHKAHGFRIVHNHDRCFHYTDHMARADNHLEEYVGASGLIVMLAFLDPGPLLARKYKGPEVRDVRDWVEIVRRLHLPYYEEARLYWRRAASDGLFEDANEVSPYSADALKTIIQQYRDKEEE